MNTYIHIHTHRGSTVIIVLFFTLLLLIGLTSSTYLLSKTLQSNSYITDTIQANYAAESGIELRLFESQLRREGYTPDTTDPFHTLQLTSGLESLSKSILQARTEPSQGVHRSTTSTDTTSLLSLSQSTGLTKTLALFVDNKTPHLSLWTPNYLIIRSNENNPIEIKFTGKAISAGYFDTLTTTIDNLGSTNSSLNIVSLSGYIRSTGAHATSSLEIESKDQQTIKTFLATHEEVYITLRNTDRNTPFTFQLESDIPFARYYKTITATGQFHDVVVKRILQLSQEQLPELFSVVLSQ